MEVDPTSADDLRIARLVYRSRVFLAVHGGAMANIIYMQPKDAAVVEIGFPEGGVPDYAGSYYPLFSQLAANIGITNYWICPHPSPNMNHGGPITADIDTLLGTLRNASALR